MALKLSELIAAYGDDKVQFQNLDQCADNLKMNGGGTTKITFGTEQRLHLDGTVKLGLVVWLDRDRVKEIISASKEPASPSDNDAPKPQTWGEWERAQQEAEHSK